MSNDDKKSPSETATAPESAILRFRRSLLRFGRSLWERVRPTCTRGNRDASYKAERALTAERSVSSSDGSSQKQESITKVNSAEDNVPVKSRPIAVVITTADNEKPETVVDANANVPETNTVNEKNAPTNPVE